MVHASLDLRLFFLTTKLQDPNVIAAAEVPGFLAQMVIVSSMLEKQTEEVYTLIHQVYKNEMMNDEDRRVCIESIWYELTEYLKVSLALLSFVLGGWYFKSLVTIFRMLATWISELRLSKENQS